MSKLEDLPRVKQPESKPVEWKMCRACKAYKAECYVPIGDVSAQMCWLCAHAVVDHDCPLHEAATHECECLPHEIYPNRAKPVSEGDVVPIPGDFVFVHGDTVSPKATGHSLHGHFYNPKTGEIEARGLPPGDGGAKLREIKARYAKHAPYIVDSSHSGLDELPKHRSSRAEALAKKRS